MKKTVFLLFISLFFATFVVGDEPVCSASNVDCLLEELSRLDPADTTKYTSPNDGVTKIMGQLMTTEGISLSERKELQKLLFTGGLAAASLRYPKDHIFVRILTALQSNEGLAESLPIRKKRLWDKILTPLDTVYTSYHRRSDAVELLDLLSSEFLHLKGVDNTKLLRALILFYPVHSGKVALESRCNLLGERYGRESFESRQSRVIATIIGCSLVYSDIIPNDMEKGWRETIFPILESILMENDGLERHNAAYTLFRSVKKVVENYVEAEFNNRSLAKELNFILNPVIMASIKPILDATKQFLQGDRPAIMRKVFLNSMYELGSKIKSKDVTRHEMYYLVPVVFYIKELFKLLLVDLSMASEVMASEKESLVQSAQMLYLFRDQLAPDHIFHQLIKIVEEYLEEPSNREEETFNIEKLLGLKKAAYQGYRSHLNRAHTYYLEIPCA